MIKLLQEYCWGMIGPSFITPAWSTLNVCMNGNLLPLMKSVSTDVSSAKILLNGLFRMEALFIGSLCVRYHPSSAGMCHFFVFGEYIELL